MYRSHKLTEAIHCVIAKTVVHKKADAKIPETKAEYINRTKHLRHSLDSLNHLQRPLFALWNISQPSENVMVEWSSLIDECISLVHSVIVSDRKRFSSLT